LLLSFPSSRSFSSIVALNNRKRTQRLTHKREHILCLPRAGAAAGAAVKLFPVAGSIEKYGWNN
ncbi:hypothetical protein O5629_27165, partial [Escherichia coli]|nr:hypothetical protein [Escherichia coli]